MLIRLRLHSDREIAFRLSGEWSRDAKDLYRQCVREQCGMRWEHAQREYVGDLDYIADVFAYAKEQQWRIIPDDPTSLAHALLKRIEELVSNDRGEHVSDLMGKLYPYQRSGRAFLASRKRALLADEMGLGKTVQTIAAIPSKDGRIVPTIIVTPASLKGVWKRELKKWRTEDVEYVHQCEGRESFIPPRAGEVMVLNYEITPKTDEYREDPDLLPLPGTVLILDEVHATKNPKASRTRKTRELAEKVRERGGAVWGLSGTPLLNRPPELWEILKTIGAHEEAFKSWGNFCELFRMNKSGTFWSLPSKEMPKMLARVSLRRERKDVLPDLPTKTYETWEADVCDPETAAICDEALADGAVLAALDALSDSSEVDFAGLGIIARARKALATSKLPKAIEVAKYFEDEGEPVVFFSAHREVIDILAKRQGWGKIVGGMSAEKKAQVQDDFQAGNYRGLAITIGAGSEGLTLTRAHRAVFIDRTWTPARNEQAEDRVCRIGQSRGVIITDLVADHELDEMIYEACLKKQRLFNRTIRKLPQHAESDGTKSANDSSEAAKRLQAIYDALTSSTIASAS